MSDWLDDGRRTDAGDAADIEAVNRAYRLFLGRDVESLQAARSKAGLSLHRLVNEFTQADEFVTAVLEPLRQGRPLPEGRFLGSPSELDVEFARRIAGPELNGGGGSWSELTGRLLKIIGLVDEVRAAPLSPPPPAPTAAPEVAAIGRQGVRRLFQLFLGRAPEAEAVFQTYAGMDAVSVAVAIAEGPEFNVALVEPMLAGAALLTGHDHRSAPDEDARWVELAFGLSPPAPQAERTTWPRLLAGALDGSSPLSRRLPAVLRSPELHEALAKWANAYRLSPARRAAYDVIRASGAFADEFYLQRYPDVAAAGLDPLFHYVSSGADEGRDPSPEFSTRFYVLNGPDLGGMNPLEHWVRGLGAAARIARPAKTVNTRPPSPQAWRENFERRLAERLTALETADLSPPWADGRPTFSLISTVYDTAPEYLHALAETVREQAFTDFEWVLLDNGSQDPGSIAACRDLAALDPRVRRLRVDDNLHIIGGNRYAFERAQGRYIVPIDSDDLLYPDSLALIADALRARRDAPPQIVYSDEQKVTVDGEPLTLMWRWPFAMSHALSTVPAAHLLVFSKEAGEKAGVYTDDYARGSHDWDSGLRIAENGGIVAVHVPEVLYGWRVHALSTASSTDAKDYIIESQSEVMRQSLARRGLEDLYSIQTVFPGSAGWYNVVRDQRVERPIDIDFVLPWSASDAGSLAVNLHVLRGMRRARRRVLFPSHLAEAVARVRRASPGAEDIVWRGFREEKAYEAALGNVSADAFAKLFISTEVTLLSQDAVWEMVSVFELDADAGLAAGPLVRNDDVVLNGGYYAGLDGFLGAPFHLWPVAAVPGHLWRLRRPATAFPLLCFGMRASLLRDGLAPVAMDRDDGLNGIELCLRAARRNVLSIIAPLLGAIAARPFAPRPGAGSAQRLRLKAQYGDRLSPALSAHLPLDSGAFDRLRWPGEDEPLSGAAYVEKAPALPLNFRLDPRLANSPTVNLLLPVVRMSSMSGGPNTALNIAFRLAEVGVAVRIMSTDIPPEADLAPIYRHIAHIGGSEKGLCPPHLTIVDPSDRAQPFPIGANDVFFATAWWTAQMAHAARRLVGGRPFIYLIQDFEPVLYPASTEYAMAEQTYGFPHVPLINTTLLADYLSTRKVGRFADPEHARSALPFEPAVDSEMFHPSRALEGDAEPGRKRRLLFYARPSTAKRNMFELGVGALRAAIANRLVSPDTWEFIGMGEPFEPVDLGGGAQLRCAPWLGFEGYARQMREADLLLSLMMSPHPSYPPLEMARCGGVAITNTYANKTGERMAGISPNILAVEPEVDALLDAVERALLRLDGRAAEAAPMTYPARWDESFATLIPELKQRLEDMGVRADAWTRSATPEPSSVRMPRAEAGSAYAQFLDAAKARRARSLPAPIEPGLFSLTTTVFDTPPAYLEVLARSIRQQQGGLPFEWLILDNGSLRSDTRALLEKLSREPHVRVERSETNLGIIGGARWLLEHARGRYIVPLDHDDYIYSDCLQVLAWHLQRHHYPPMLYSDEDKVLDDRSCMPLQKPGWDPVLFVDQCYTSHINVFDREVALSLSAYADLKAEASPDWDIQMRFFLAGHALVHVPEILYGWRIHPQSTAAGNMAAKPIVYQSHRAVLGRYLAALPSPERFSLEASPLFDGAPDWWVRRKRRAGRPVTTLVLTSIDDAGEHDLKAAPGIDHRIVRLSATAPVERLLEEVRRCEHEGRLVHLAAGGTSPDDDEWAWEAIGLFERFPDAVGVGGRIHSYGEIISSAQFLGFGEDGFSDPDRGRPLDDPGYCAWMWKTRSVGAVSALHAVYDPSFLRRTVELAATWDCGVYDLGRWAGALARREGHRIIYSPYISAGTTEDWDARVDPRARGRLLAAFSDLAPDRTLRPAYVGTRRETAYTPTPEPDFAPSPDRAPPPDYAHGLAARLAAPAAALAAAKELRFSILTTLYIRSDAALFRLTADSVLAQTHRGFEWVVLAHGPTSRDLDGVLERLADEPRVRILRLPENLGIMGGTRRALEAARGEYVVPLDGDDLLTADALALLADRIGWSPEPLDYVYSDEDLLVGGRLCQPYLRPDWDPVLDLENSWIWHVGAYRREAALEADLYTDPGSEFCHDWDTAHRLGSRSTAAHVRAPLYHWRQHEQSLSNSGKEESGSSRSVRHLLEAKLRIAGQTDRYRVRPFPIFRGAEEWRLAPVDSGGGDIAEIAIGPSCDLDDLADQADAMEGNAVVRLSAGRQGPVSDDGLGEALKFLDLLPDLAAVTGRLRRDGIVISGGVESDEQGRLWAPYDGRRADDLGPYVLAAKPHAITAPIPEMVFIRAGVLRDALASRDGAWLTPAELGLWLGAWAEARGRHIAWSPLIEAELLGEPLWTFDRVATPIAWRAFRRLAGADGPPQRRGVAAWSSAYFA